MAYSDALSRNPGAGWTPAAIPSQQGRRILITGANSGVGYAAAVELARHGATVLMACRDRNRGEAALKQLQRAATCPESAVPPAELVLLDLASLDSIRRVIDELAAMGKPLDGLINNAGVMAPPRRQVTADGFELQFGTNVLGHFALTCGLLPLLEASGSNPAPRIVTLASIAHKTGTLNFDDLNAERSYNPRGAYAQSKLADLMLALLLEQKLRERGARSLSIAVHPGVARTNLFKVGNSQGLARTAEKFIAFTIGSLLNSDLGGAVPTLFAMTCPEAQGGCYYGSQGFFETRGGDVGPAKIAPQALDEVAQRRLWAVCEEATGFTV
jgi:NAD(P)-dependent dehydrogenase (short-subunit alcohol dehydrogenase family)